MNVFPNCGYHHYHADYAPERQVVSQTKRRRAAEIIASVTAAVQAKEGVE